MGKDNMLLKDTISNEEFEYALSLVFDNKKMSRRITVDEEDEEYSVMIIYYYDTGKEGIERYAHIGTWYVDLNDIDFSSTVSNCHIFSKEHIHGLYGKDVEFKIE